MSLTNDLRAFTVVHRAHGTADVQGKPCDGHGLRPQTSVQLRTVKTRAMGFANIEYNPMLCDTFVHKIVKARAGSTLVSSYTSPRGAGAVRPDLQSQSNAAVTSRR